MSIANAITAAAEEGVPMNVINAGADFYNRKNRRTDPPGKFDKVGRFYADEQTYAVRNVRSPSKNWPYSQMNAARTAAHCAEVRGVDDEQLLIVKRIAMSAERGDTIDDARKFIGAAWRKFVKAEMKRLKAEAEGEAA